ncbi:Ubiquitin-conjugating enzyme E2 U [Cladochytrium tenue]|nr:Ubiquitin-conjugating enzyme E2 U [Cladochytrium tenue]
MTTGRPCLSLLDDPNEWEPGMSLAGLLVALQMMLSNPAEAPPGTFMEPANPVAADMLDRSPRLYAQIARDCVLASRRLEAGLSPHPEDEPPAAGGIAGIIRLHGGSAPCGDVEQQANNDAKNAPLTREAPRVKSLSFADYHAYWLSLASSRPAAGEPVTTTGIISKKRTKVPHPQGALATAAFPATAEVDSELAEKIEQHRVLRYGRFRKGATGVAEHAAHIARSRSEAEARRLIYSIPAPSIPAPVASDHNQVAGDSDWEAEAHALVDWAVGEVPDRTMAVDEDVIVLNEQH